MIYSLIQKERKGNTALEINIGVGVYGTIDISEAVRFIFEGEH